MRKLLLFRLTIVLGILIFTLDSYSQIYPNNEEGDYEDMLTPEYYLTDNGQPFRNELNKFVHFTRLISFIHPFEDTTGNIPEYTINRAFGDALVANSQHHPAVDMHVENGAANVIMYAAYDGLVHTYRDAAKYRDYLSLTKNVEDSTDNIIGKIVTLYAHIDLNLDSLDNLLLNGQSVSQGDVISKHLYAGTLGGPHIHFEIRYYRTYDEGSEVFYGFVGPGGSTTLTVPSAGSWSYGFWDPNYGYGFANPENHLQNSSTGVVTNEFQNKTKAFPIPTKDYVTIDLNKTYNNIGVSIYSLVGKLLDQKEVVNTASISIDLSGFNSGIYLIRLTNIETSERTVIKVVKE